MIGMRSPGTGFNLRAIAYRSVQRLERRATAAEQIENKHYNCYDQQGVNQTAAYMHGKTQKP